MEDERETAYLRQRRTKSSISLTCCFHGHSRDSHDSSSSPSPDVDKSSPMLISPSSWFRSKGHELPEAKGKGRSFVNRIGLHARRHSGDFSYDPLSYALNFDDAHLDDFTARLPVSPPQRSDAASRIRNIELPSPRNAGRRCIQNPKVEAAPQIKSIEMSSAETAVGRRSVENPTAVIGGRSGVERPPAVSREISVEL